MILRILDEATAEFADAIAYYQDIESGLGVRFRQDVQARQLGSRITLSCRTCVRMAIAV
jgi:hypothetical protein